MIILKCVQYRKVVWCDVMTADFVVLFSRFSGNSEGFGFNSRVQLGEKA